MLLAHGALAAACASPPPAATQPDPAELGALRDAILALPGAGDAEEATLIARTALETVQSLAASYRMTWPPLLHNNLFHVGLRPRGLCCHWAEDLSRALDALPLEHYRTWWLVAHLGNRWREHNTPAVAPIDNAWSESLILDGWRDAGALYYASPRGDRYPWTLHPLDARRDVLRCIAQ